MNNKQNNTNNKFGRVLAVPSLCDLYPGIYLKTEEKAQKNLSQGSRRDIIIINTISAFKKQLTVYENDRKEQRT
jgi:hypothetical protein